MGMLSTARLHMFPIIATVGFLGMGTPAVADPLAITFGTLRFVPVSATPPEVTVIVFNLSGPDFSIPVADSNPEEFVLWGLAIATADPRAPTLPVGGGILVNLSAPLAVRGVSLPEDCCAQVLLDLTFTGAPVASVETADGVAGTGPFRVTGELMATTADSGAPLVFRHAVAGTGVARVGFRLSAEQPQPFAEYTFEAESPVPEPGTLVLVTASAAVLVRRRLRRRFVDLLNRRANLCP